ncbi:beta-phosphoglucomutase-like phosphatase (HAD superfamily) [Roseinatronobacter thiooxidans]|uniref:N-acylneuraminate cytidylyltransferase n=1 Tax=Roseinatronobacter thiooxidans TaxID=121821 RepID=A0A2W7PQD9_9RHOB|nr:HAD hydrolase-like protein [Roseinatronobacter thiooxidans]PZX38318.1 beta-phosphoglucomutase-like phosphatase (HAD superfamily) [Roseinatronobacter thiooxidans]
MKVAAFVPVKLRSRRLPNKNFLRLGNKPLVSHVLDTLLTVPTIHDVYCYSSQEQILPLLPSGVKYLPRPNYLDGDEIKANELFQYAVDRLDADVLVLCHATGPFISAESIAKGVDAVLSGNYDCSFAVQEHKTYCWYGDKPLNYDPGNMAQTQDLVPVMAETSGFYVFKAEDYRRTGTRINGRPKPIPIDFREAVDIDEPSDFRLALQLLHPHPEQDLFEDDHFFVNLAADGATRHNVRHICFDMDGVLIDSIPVMKQAWAAVCAEMGFDIPFDGYRENIGRPFNDILSRIGISERHHARVKEIYDAKSLELEGSIHVYPGVIETLKAFRAADLKISIATSKTLPRAESILKTHFSDVAFDTLITPEAVRPGRGKPHPDQLLQAALNLGVSPGESIYVGDMDVDMMASDAAGFSFVHADWGYGDLLSSNRVWFRSIEDMAAFLITT